MYKIWDSNSNYTKNFYKEQYNTYKDVHKLFDDSKQIKSYLWNALTKKLGMDETGVVKLMDIDTSNPEENLEKLIRETVDYDTRKILYTIRNNVPVRFLEKNMFDVSGMYFNRDFFKNAFEKEWPFKKTNQAKLTKVITKIYGDVIGQVFSKIYSTKRQTVYISVRPSDYWMISDSTHYSSCHSTFCSDMDYKWGNTDYMLDDSTFLIYTGEPDGSLIDLCWSVQADEEYDEETGEYFYPDDTEEMYEVISPNMSNRVLGLLSHDKKTVLLGKPYGRDNLSYTQIFNKLAEVFDITESAEQFEAQDVVDYWGQGYNDNTWTAYGEKFEYDAEKEMFLASIGRVVDLPLKDKVAV